MNKKLISIFICTTFLMCFTVNANEISKSYIDKTSIDQFTLMFNSGPDLETEDNLNWVNVEPGSTVTGSFKVKNIGEPDSELDWEITEYPPWGTWTFNPLSGENLKPEDEKVTVVVTVIAPNENGKFEGRIKVENVNNNQDYKFVLVSLSTPKNKNVNINFFHRILNEKSLLFLLIKQIIKF